MVSLDLKDAYLHVPVYLSHWRFLHFALGTAEDDFIVHLRKVLPFGLATAPRVFTKLLARVVAHLHLQRCPMYSNIDVNFHAQAFCQHCHTSDINLCCHFTRGFTVNLKKSALVPSQVMLHL